MNFEIKSGCSGLCCNLWLLHPGLPLCMTVTWLKNIVDISWLPPVHTPFVTPVYVTDSPMLFQTHLLNTLWSFSPLDCDGLYCRCVINSSKMKRSTNLNIILFLSSPEILQSASLTHWAIFNSRSCRSSSNNLLSGYIFYIAPSSPPIISKKIRFFFLKLIAYIIHMTLKRKKK